MPGTICPNCQASLDDDLVASTGEAECPFCGTELPRLESSGEVSSRDVRSRPATTTAAGTAAGGSTVAGLPAGSKIQLVEQSRDRLVIYVPEGGKRTRGIGCFALLWNGFMLVFTAAMIAAGETGDAPLLVVIPFIGLFWAVGLGILYWWLRMRFTRTYLLLERGRLVIQRLLFGRKSTTETLLNDQSRAELIVAYEQNDQPVYSVAVNGSDRTAKFGTALSIEEKSWFTRKFNSFLGVQQPTPKPEELLVQGFSEAEHPPEVRPAEIPANSAITILDSSRDVLRFQLPAVPSRAVRYIVALFAGGFSLLWCGGSLLSLVDALNGNRGGMDGIEAVIAGVFLLVGLVPLGMALFVYRGKMTADLTRERLKCWWHWGPFGIRKEMPTPSIIEVVVAGTGSRARRPGKASVRRRQMKLCLVRAANHVLPLTMFHDADTARQAAGLIRHQLREMGFPLHEPAA